MSHIPYYGEDRVKEISLNDSRCEQVKSLIDVQTEFNLNMFELYLKQLDFFRSFLKF